MSERSSEHNGDQSPHDDEPRELGDDVLDGVESLADDADSQPRRAASAEFVVTAETGSQAAMREAMDPANQSLADALRLSYRILQLGMLGLIVAFLFSGFQTLEEGATGVKTFFGRIVDGDEQPLEPGLHPFWPYPVGELVVVPQSTEIELLDEFWPKDNEGRRLQIESAADTASATRPLRAGIDGYLVTADGGFVHTEVAATYSVDDAADFLRQISPDDATRLVRLALHRGVTTSAGTFTIEDFVDLRDEPARLARERAQQILDRLDSGIEITSLTLARRTAPAAVLRKYREVQVAREDAKTAVDQARQDVAKALTGVAGDQAWRDLLAMIGDYEAELTRGDLEQADARLDAIGARLEAGDVGGEAARIVSQARAYQSLLETRLQSEYQRVTAYLPAFETNPDQFVRQLWLEAIGDVLDNEFAEIFSVPQQIASVNLAVQSSEQVMQARRQADLERRKRAADLRALEFGPALLGRRGITLEGPGRRLNRDGSRGFGRTEEE